MTGTKYIVVSNDVSKIDHMIIFPANIDHSKMAKMMKMLTLCNIESAGFIDEFMQCYGESSSLRKQSRNIDTTILKSMLSIDDKKIVFDDENNPFMDQKKLIDQTDLHHIVESICKK